MLRLFGRADRSSVYHIGSWLPSEPGRRDIGHFKVVVLVCKLGNLRGQLIHSFLRRALFGELLQLIWTQTQIFEVGSNYPFVVAAILVEFLSGLIHLYSDIFFGLFLVRNLVLEVVLDLLIFLAVHQFLGLLIFLEPSVIIVGHLAPELILLGIAHLYR